MDAKACFKKGGNWFFPDKNKCVLVEAKPVDVNWDKQKEMAQWTKKDARQVAKVLRPLVGKKVMLYGGGGRGGDLCKLESIRTAGLTLYPEGRKPYKSKTKYKVEAKLKTLENWENKTAFFGELVKSADVVNDKYIPPKYKETTFDPSLGSWKLAEVTTYKVIK